MSQMGTSNANTTDRLPLRQSLFIWLLGAILGWGIAFAGIYSLLDYGDNLQANQQAEELQKIAPAAGK